jgi:hypothetical protein
MAVNDFLYLVFKQFVKFLGGVDFNDLNFVFDLILNILFGLIIGDLFDEFGEFLLNFFLPLLQFFVLTLQNPFAGHEIFDTVPFLRPFL